MIILRNRFATENIMNIKKNTVNLTWWFRPLAFRRQRQAEFNRCEAMLVTERVSGGQSEQKEKEKKKKN